MDPRVGMDARVAEQDERAREEAAALPPVGYGATVPHTPAEAPPEAHESGSRSSHLSEGIGNWKADETQTKSRRNVIADAERRAKANDSFTPVSDRPGGRGGLRRLSQRYGHFDPNAIVSQHLSAWIGRRGGSAHEGEGLVDRSEIDRELAEQVPPPPPPNQINNRNKSVRCVCSPSLFFLSFCPASSPPRSCEPPPTEERALTSSPTSHVTFFRATKRAAPPEEDKPPPPRLTTRKQFFSQLGSTPRARTTGLHSTAPRPCATATQLGSPPPERPLPNPTVPPRPCARRRQ